MQPVGGAAFGHLLVREGKSKNAKRAVSLTVRVNAMLEERQRREPWSQWVFAGDTPETHILVTSLDHQHVKVARPTVKGRRYFAFQKNLYCTRCVTPCSLVSAKLGSMHLQS